MQVKKEIEDAEYTTGDEIFDKVSSNLSRWFQLEFSEPFYRGKLFSDLGFMREFTTVQAILDMTYKFTANTDLATNVLLLEAYHIYNPVTMNDISIYITVKGSISHLQAHE